MSWKILKRAAVQDTFRYQQNLFPIREKVGISFQHSLLDSVKSILLELRKAGYIVLSCIIGVSGRIIAWRHDVYDNPIESPVAEHITVRLKENDTEQMARHPEYHADNGEMPQ